MMQLIPKSAQTTSNWSGGTTTQLFIYPPEASYAARNFLFRISTATVETETSTFTDLTGFNRILLLLNGELNITHNNSHTVALKAYQPHSFDGGWHTTAVGKVTDFNVISNPNIQAQVTVIELDANQSTQLNTTANWVCLYVTKGAIKVQQYNEEITINENDFLIIPSANETEVLALQNSLAVASFIYLH
jgi:environmental stress-induced protein Ves